mmetsp:Transcript_85240/g.275100  ORF Transcript_85240/g.275100 Transcript_85240/m.275100 type:complete len:95 (-) Transcript_85240:75-359(-)
MSWRPLVQSKIPLRRQETSSYAKSGQLWLRPRRCFRLRCHRDMCGHHVHVDLNSRANERADTPSIWHGEMVVLQLSAVVRSMIMMLSPAGFRIA